MIDNKDNTILKTLEENARTSYMELARNLGISEGAVRKRIKKLEKEYVILGYKASINYKKLGYSNKIIMGVDTKPDAYLKVINQLKELPYIKDLATSSGDHMIMFNVWIKNIEELNKILEDLNSIEGVTRSCPSIIHEKLENNN